MTLFEDVVRQRRSARNFLATPLSDLQIRQVLQDAQHAPSNCNTQPWNVHIVSGKKKADLTSALLRDAENGMFAPDFSFDASQYLGVYAERRREQGRRYYEALGIGRADKDGRTRSHRRNLEFFGAPHAAFLFMPAIGDCVRVASDVGMYAQNFLLALTARGFAGVPQTILGYNADTVRGALGVSEELKLLFGISFGYEDPDGKSASVRMERASIDANVTFHE